MFRFNRALLTASTLALGLALSACESFDPTDMMPNNWFGGGKKPLPGDRHAVFPEGVPGVPQGVPPEMLKGNQQQFEEQPPAAALAEPAPAPRAAKSAATQPKPKPKAKKPSTAQAQPAAAAPTEPNRSAASPWPGQPSPNVSPWPDAPRPNTFSR
jgi:hypothetical protein